MNTAYDEKGNIIGKFLGAFIVNASGRRIYWVEGGEVLAPTVFGGECGVTRSAWSLIGEIDGQVARNELGSIIFIVK